MLKRPKPDLLINDTTTIHDYRLPMSQWLQNRKATGGMNTFVSSEKQRVDAGHIFNKLLSTHLMKKRKRVNVYITHEHLNRHRSLRTYMK